MFASPDAGLVWCINAKILLHIAFAIPNVDALSSRSQKTLKDHSQLSSYLSIQPLRIPSLKNSQTTLNSQKTLTSTLSESPSSLHSSLLSIPFSSIGNTHTHTHTHTHTLSLTHIHTHFALFLYAMTVYRFDSLILSWVCRHLSIEKNRRRQSLGSRTQDTLRRPTNSKFCKLFVLICVLGFPFLV